MRDPIDIVETIYALGGDEQEWVDRLVKSFRPYLSLGHGLVAQTYDANRLDRVVIRSTAMCDVDPRLMAARPGAELPEPEHRFLLPILRTGFVATLRGAPAALRRSGLTEERIFEYERRLDEILRAWKLADQFWVNAQDPTYFGCCFMAFSKKRSRWLPRETEHWRRISAHVSAAFRIRRQFASAGGKTLESAFPEAILSPDGHLQYAAQAAQGGGVRASLRRAVLALDRARGPLRHRDPEQALALWQALVAGRWSLLDHFDSDGRRFIVAHRNDARAPDMRGLTPREQQVAAHAALGHSNKVIAYQLGLAVSTVGEHLTRARKKLRALDSAAVRGPPGVPSREYGN